MKKLFTYKIEECFIGYVNEYMEYKTMIISKVFSQKKVKGVG